MPETISTKHIYKGRIFDIRVDTIREGKLEYERDIIAHPGSGVIVPVYEDGTVALVRQYRHASGAARRRHDSQSDRLGLVSCGNLQTQGNSKRCVPSFRCGSRQGQRPE